MTRHPERSEGSPAIREDLALNLEDGGCLALHRFRRAGAQGQPVLMVHGAIENGRIFYAERAERGLAYFLAAQGFDVFVADFRGRGASRPAIAAGATFGQTELITEDIPRLSAYLTQLHPDSQQIWMAHSWGGVLLSATLARFPALIPRVQACVYFGSKRQVLVRHWRRWLMVDMIWNRLCPLLAALYGYLPAKRFGLGDDSETRLSLAESIAWVRPGPWHDPRDGFRYDEAWQSGLRHPRLLMLTGVADHSLGHADDVRRFAAELSCDDCQIEVLAAGRNARHDYGHIDLLTHRDAESDHFPRIVSWLKEEARVKGVTR